MSDRQSLSPVDAASALIGVIDIRNAAAVHAIAGLRSQYRAVQADGIADGDAVELAKRYQRWQVPALYIADLDAICSGQANERLLGQLASLASRCLIDAGSCSPQLSCSLEDKKIHFVIPTESFANVDDWARACDRVGPAHVVMGLDLIGDQLRTLGRTSDQEITPTKQGENLFAWLDRAKSIGVRSVMALDLAYVGTDRGPGCDVACRMIRDYWNSAELISGGGVRDQADVNRLRQAGCDRVLVGTALHRDESMARLLGIV